VSSRNDTKTFWRLLKGNNNCVSDKHNEISADMWYNYFRKLLFKDDQPNLTTMDWDYKIVGDENDLILNESISQEEIRNSILTN